MKKLYPSRLINSKTGKPIMLPHGNTKGSKLARKLGREAGLDTLKILNENEFERV